MEHEKGEKPKIKLKIGARTAEEKQSSWTEEAAKVFKLWEKTQSQNRCKERSIIERRLVHHEKRAARAKYPRHRDRELAILTRIHRQAQRMRERHAKEGREEERKKSWTLEKTGCTNLYKMAKKPEGQQTEVIEMKTGKHSTLTGRETANTQEEIAAEYTAHLDRTFNKHVRELEEDPKPEIKEQRRTITCDEILRRIKRTMTHRNTSEVMNGATLVEILSADNLRHAIKEVKKGTVPAKDGFPAEFYSDAKVSEVLIPHLQELYKEIITNGRMSAAQREALVSMLYKGKGKDKKATPSYRPIAITPLEYRILTHAIQRKLLPAVLQIIGRTQVGYTGKTRQAHDNTILIGEMARTLVY